MLEEVEVAAPGTYTLDFKSARRPNDTAGPHDFRVLVDGQPVATFTSTSTAFVDRSVPLALPAGRRTIALQGVNSAGGDKATLLDSPRLIRPESPVRPGQPGFEAPDAGTGFALGPAASRWSFSPTAGVATPAATSRLRRPRRPPMTNPAAQTD